MQITAKTLDIACLSVFVIVAIGGGYLVANSVASQARRTTQHIQNMEGLLWKLGEAERALATVETAVQANQDALEALRKRLPESRDMGEFLSALDEVTKRNGVVLSKVAPGETVANELCHRIAVQFHCKGAFADLHATLHGIETMERIVQIEQVSISGGGAPGAQCSMDVSCGVFSQ